MSRDLFSLVDRYVNKWTRNERRTDEALTSGGGGQGGGRPGEKGVGGVREAGEEGAGGGIPKVAGSGRKREKSMQHCAIFRN